MGILLALPSVAFGAHRHHYPLATPVPIASVRIKTPEAISPMCFNYGHQPLVNGAYDMAQVASDLALLKSKGFNCIRTADYGLNADITKSLALYAKSQGFKVQIGNDDSGNGLNSSMLSAYDAGVIANAKWAQANHIDELSVGNEQEYRLSGLSKSSWISHVKSLASQVKRYYSGKVSYATSGDFVDDWIRSGSLGSLDALGLNLYCGYDCNASSLTRGINKFGRTHIEITETNCDIKYVPSCQTDAGLALEVQNDAIKLLNFGVPTYFFAFRSGGDGTPDYWQVLQYPLTMQALGLR